MRKRTQPRRGALPISPARRLDRRLYYFLRRRLDRPEALDALAQAIFDRLPSVSDRRLACAPLQCLYALAARAAKTLESGIDEDHAPCERARLEQHLKESFQQLPPLHAAVLLAHARDGRSVEEIGATLKLPLPVVEKLCSQAKALMRCMPWTS